MKLWILRLIIEILCLIALLGSILFLALTWKSIPDTVPIHFSARGEIDQWGPRRTLITLPVINGVMYLFLTAMNAVALLTKRQEMPPSAGVWLSGLKLGVVALFALIGVYSALARPLPIWLLTASMVWNLVPILGLVVAAARFEARRKKRS